MLKKSLFLITLLLMPSLALTAYDRIILLSPGYFPDPTRGTAIAGAQIYVGDVDTDPEVETNQKQITILQENGSYVEISQPVSTGAGGVPVYNGSTVTIYVEGKYSLKVLNSSGSQVYYVPNSETKNEFSTDSFLLFDGTDPTKQIDFDASGITTGNTRTIIMPDHDVDLGAIGAGINHFINSAWAVNQEAYTGGVITTGEYGHDMMKSISSASYTITDKALTMVSGTLGQRNDELANLHGESLTVSVISGSLTLGATGGAAATVITAGNPYMFTLDMDQATDFITFTAATDALNIKFDTGTASTLYVEPEPVAEADRCYYYYWRGFAIAKGNHLAFGTSSDGLSGPIMAFPTAMREIPTMAILTAPTYTNSINYLLVATKEGAMHVLGGSGSTFYKAIDGVYEADARY